MPDHFFVYPAYLLRSLSRDAGRRVPSPRAVTETTVEGILEAAKRLGLQATAEPEKRYSREPFAQAGRVRIQKKAGLTKVKALLLLADDLRAHPVPRNPS
jgi:signal recognition particle subunit SRP19